MEAIERARALGREQWLGHLMGELVRLLALPEHGLPVEVVLEEFLPDVGASTARHRLRQVLLRLRAVAADLVIREEDHLRLAPAWVDVREFLAAPALAIRSGPLLPTDEYAEWSRATREQVEYHRQLPRRPTGPPEPARRSPPA